MLRIIPLRGVLAQVRQAGRAVAPAVAPPMRSVHSNPSVKTSLLLRCLPPSATLADITESLKDISCRKVELEPGCTLHLKSHAEAHAASQHFEKMNLEVSNGGQRLFIFKTCSFGSRGT